MKTLSLVISRILNDFSKSKGMMTIYAIGSVLCVLVFIYFYSNIQILYQEYEDFMQSLFNRSYSVFMLEPSKIQSHDLEFLYDDDKVENINLTGNYEDSGVNANLNTYSSIEYIQKELLHDVKSKENDQLLKLAKENMNNNVIFTNSKEETVMVNGVPFKNIYTDTELCNYIPLNAFLNNNFPADKISIIFFRHPNPVQNSDFVDLLHEHFDKYQIDNEISDANGGDMNYFYNQIIFEILRLCLIYIIGFIGCAFLFKYMFDLNRYENIVYSIVGASKLKVTKIMLLEATIMSIISIIIAIVLHITLYNCFFTYINRQEIVYTSWDYLIIGIFSFVLSLLTLIPFFIPYMKNPIMKSKTRYE